MFNKPGPSGESVFQGEEAVQVEVWGSTSNIVPEASTIYFVQPNPGWWWLLCNDNWTNELCPIIFFAVIALPTINLLKSKIGAHLKNLKEHFPNVSIILKQHYLVHIPSMIKQLGPLIRHSCFGFESAHNYFKNLARKQNFKNLPKSLAERCQIKECGNFGAAHEAAHAHPLFAAERKFEPLSAVTEKEIAYLSDFVVM